MSDLYKTIRATSEGYYTEKRSRFLSFAIPVRTPEEVKAQVEACRKKYYDARHVCWAYMLGADRTTFRANDDGEPSSTAGKPILGQINSNELTDILVIVVRYFGGIKLGTSGLIHHACGERDATCYRFTDIRSELRDDTPCPPKSGRDVKEPFVNDRRCLSKRQLTRNTQSGNPHPPHSACKSML